MRSYFSMFGIGVPVWTILPLLIVIGGCGDDDDPNRKPYFVQPYIISVEETQNKTFYINQNVTLVAFAIDPDGDTLSYRWKVMSKSEEATIKPFVSKDKSLVSTDQAIQFTASEEGSYPIVVTADDHKGGITTYDEFSIEVKKPKIRSEKLEIVEPKNGDSVSLDTKICGTYYLIPKDEGIAVFIRSDKTNSKWRFLAYATVFVDGYWTADIIIREENDTKSFHIGVALTDQKYIEEDTFSIPPEFDDMITVVRK